MLSNKIYFDMHAHTYTHIYKDPLKEYILFKMSFGDWVYKHMD